MGKDKILWLMGMIAVGVLLVTTTGAKSENQGIIGGSEVAMAQTATSSELSATTSPRDENQGVATTSEGQIASTTTEKKEIVKNVNEKAEIVNIQGQDVNDPNDYRKMLEDKGVEFFDTINTPKHVYKLFYQQLGDRPELKGLYVVWEEDIMRCGQGGIIYDGCAYLMEGKLRLIHVNINHGDEWLGHVMRHEFAHSIGFSTEEGADKWAAENAK